MNPCEKILSKMNPVIRAYHSGCWVYELPSSNAEILYSEWRERNDVTEAIEYKPN